MTTAVPVPLLTPAPTLGAITVLVENPTGQSLVLSNEVWRRETGGLAERLAVGIERNGTWTDYTPGSGRDYQYQVVAHGTDGSSSTSAWAGIVVARYNVTRLGAAVFG